MRPNWTDYYLGLAFFAAARSHDIETQHGCIICDDKHRPLGMGYNGYPGGIYEAGLPNTRPDKYPWMIHSEANAVNNMRLKIDGTTAYVTGQCCNPCIMNMYNNGVRTVYMAKCHGSHILKEEDKKFFDDFLDRAAAGGDPMKINYVEPNLNWLTPVIVKLVKLGFIDKDNLTDLVAPEKAPCRHPATYLSRANRGRYCAACNTMVESEKEHKFRTGKGFNYDS